MQLDASSKWDPRYESVVRGWHPLRNIQLERPKLKNNRFLPLREGGLCLVRFVHEGSAYAFSTHVEGWDKMLEDANFRLAWPEVVEKVAFRESERIKISLPCRIVLSGSEHSGEICDISPDGCGVRVEGHVTEGTEIELSFSLPGGLPFENICATVRNVCPQGTTYILGCEFEKGQPLIQNDFGLFLTLMRERKGTQTPAEPRVLIIGKDPDDIVSLEQGFGFRGWTVFTAPTALEGMWFLRMFKPNVLVVNQVQDDLSGIDIAKVIRASKSLGALPIFVYGDMNPDMQQQARNAGVSACFSHPVVARLIFDAADALFPQSPVESRTFAPKADSERHHGGLQTPVFIAATDPLQEPSGVPS